MGKYIFILLLIASCVQPASKQDTDTTTKKSEMIKEPIAQASGDNLTTSSMNDQQDKIVINGIMWDEKMKAEFKNVYGKDPIPGNYWYDAASGLWGNMGGPALSFIYPGHNYGKLESNVSKGNTGIFINGREIPLVEAYIWSLVMGVPAQLGRYWLNGLGYVGYEGYPTPLFNLFILARQNSYTAKGGSDNFWSSSLARGNEQDGFGYVSIPGSGITVTYGN